MSSPQRLTGQERLTGDVLSDVPVLDFWQWAFSDLRMNNLRGVYAEWLVAKLLGIDPPVRDSWAAWDLQAPNGVTIEVKSSAYLQAWAQVRPSSIVFSGLRGQTWHPESGYSGEATYNADLYVFCLNVESNPDRYDVLNLDQWRFFLLSRDRLAERSVTSLSLGTLRTLSPEMTAPELHRSGQTAITTIADVRRGDVG